MALSNWELLAFDNDGNPCNGVLQVGPTSLEIYKSKLYVRDERMWHEGSRWIKPTIAEIYEGHLYISNFEIQACRSVLQNAIFCYVESNFEDEPKKMAGIGCYAFKTAQDYAKELGLDHTLDWHIISANESGNWLRYIERFYDETENDVESERIEIPKELSENTWVGVRKDTFDHFINWLDSILSVKEGWFEKVKANKAMQFNQGDAYFAKVLKVPTPTKEIIDDKTTQNTLHF